MRARARHPLDEDPRRLQQVENLREVVAQDEAVVLDRHAVPATPAPRGAELDGRCGREVRRGDGPPTATSRLLAAERAQSRAAARRAGRPRARDLRHFDQVLGVLEAAPESIDPDVEALIAERNAARARKDFAAADAIRQQLAARGIELLDGKDGVKWRAARGSKRERPTRRRPNAFPGQDPPPRRPSPAGRAGGGARRRLPGLRGTAGQEDGAPEVGAAPPRDEARAGSAGSPCGSRLPPGRMVDQSPPSLVRGDRGTLPLPAPWPSGWRRWRRDPGESGVAKLKDAARPSWTNPCSLS